MMSFIAAQHTELQGWRGDVSMILMLIITKSNLERPICVRTVAVSRRLKERMVRLPFVMGREHKLHTVGQRKAKMVPKSTSGRTRPLFARQCSILPLSTDSTRSTDLDRWPGRQSRSR